MPVCAVPAYAGSLEDGERALAPLRAFGPPLADMVAPLPYPKLQTLLDEGFPFGLQNYWKSSFIPTLTDEAIDTAVGIFREVTSPLTGVLFEGWAARSTASPPTRPRSRTEAVTSTW
jgi:hypothetical protein